MPHLVRQAAVLGTEFFPTSVVATVSGGVPEPTTWAIMLTGVAMIGGGLRMTRRKNAMALTAA
jgi:hypothetical protein